MKRQSSYTLGSFLRQLSRSTPQESKLLMLRNIELFHVRPDLFTKAVAAVPWENALSLLDSAFYVMKGIEPRSYQVALTKVALAQAAKSYEDEVTSSSRSSSMDDELMMKMMNNKINKNSSSSSSSNWKSSIKLLSRLVMTEGDQTPPSSYSLAAQCLSPTRQWEQAIQILLKSADERNVVSKSLLLNVAECCSTPAAWSYGLRCLSLAKPDWLTSANPGLQQISSFSSSSSSSSTTSNLLLDEGAEETTTTAHEQEETRKLHQQTTRILTKLLISSPWKRTLAILTSKDARESGVTSAILDDETNVTNLIESWLVKKQSNSNNETPEISSSPPGHIIEMISQKSAVLSLPSFNNDSANSNEEGTSSTSLVDMSLSSSSSSSLSNTMTPAQLRLRVSIALKSKDLNTLTSLLNKVGTCSTIGKARVSAALTMILLSDNNIENRHEMAIQIAQRALAEGVSPLSPICLKAIVASYHYRYFTQLLLSAEEAASSAEKAQQQPQEQEQTDTTTTSIDGNRGHHPSSRRNASSSSSSRGPVWVEALGLVSGLSTNSMSFMMRNSSSSSENPFTTAASAPLRSATGEEIITSQSYHNTTQFIDDSRTLTKLIQLCAVVCNAPEPALKLIGLAKNSNLHQHQRKSEVRLEHERVLSAMLFCQQYGRWKEAITVFEKFWKEQQAEQTEQRKHNNGKKKSHKTEGVVKVLYQILQVILSNEGKEEMLESIKW